MPSLKSIRDQVIVITGASSGMGLATARAAASQGARVFLAARDEAALAEICDDINARGGEADFLATDAGSEEAVDALAAAAIVRFGGFDTWVNVAGVGMIGQFKDISTEDHRRLFETNYWGVVYGSLAAARHFRETEEDGAIVNVGSAASDMPVPFSGPYAASKFAVKAFTNCLRIDLKQEGLPVSVTLIKPSAVDSKFADHAKTVLPGATLMPPPRYAPSVVAAAILNAAQHPRREIAVGSAAYFGGMLAQIFPRMTEWALSKVNGDTIIDDTQPRPDADNLHAAPEEGEERSGHRTARNFSVTTAAQMHPQATMAIASMLLTAGVMALRGRAGDHRRLTR